MTRSARLWFWLRLVDLLAWRWSGSRAWMWAIRKASDAIDWSELGADCGDGVSF